MKPLDLPKRPSQRALATATAQLAITEKKLPHICGGAGKFRRANQETVAGKLVPIRKPLTFGEPQKCGCVVKREVKAQQKAAAVARAAAKVEHTAPAPEVTP